MIWSFAELVVVLSIGQAIRPKEVNVRVRQYEMDLRHARFRNRAGDFVLVAKAYRRNFFTITKIVLF